MSSTLLQGAEAPHTAHAPSSHDLIILNRWTLGARTEAVAMRLQRQSLTRHVSLVFADGAAPHPAIGQVRRRLLAALLNASK